ncbi:hypothetical protein [Fibrella aestuarina]|nr:hypothetical protein [Fibrella aestuarina]
MKNRTIINSLFVIVIFILIFAIYYFEIGLPIVTFVFFSFVLIELISEYIGVNNLLKFNKRSKHDLSVVVHISLPFYSNKTFIGKIIRELNLFIAILNNALSWPYLVYFIHLRRDINVDENRMNFISSIKLNSLQVYYTLYYLLFSLLLLLLFHYQLIDSTYIVIYSITLILAISCYLCIFILSTEKFADIFKSSPRSIIGRVLIVCTGIIVSIFINFAIVLSFYNKNTINLGVITILFNEFIKQESLGLLWKGQFSDLKLLNLIIDLIGLLFASTILDAIKNIKSFKRNHVDFGRIASAYIFKKKYNDSLSWLKKINQSNQDKPYWYMYMSNLIGLNQIDKSLAYLYYIPIHISESDFPEDQKYFQLINTLKSYNINQSLILDVFKRWVQICKCDALLFCFIFYSSINDSDDISKLYLDELESIDNADVPFSNLVAKARDLSTIGLADLLNEQLVVHQKYLDAFTLCIMNLTLVNIYHTLGYQKEIISSMIKDVSITSVSLVKENDLFLTSCLMAGILSEFEKESSHYETFLYVYNETKGKLSSIDNLSALDNITNFISVK